MNETFGKYLRTRREELHRHRGDFSVRKFAEQLGIQPSYISRIELEEVPPPSEETIISMALLLQEDPDVLLAMAGKVSSDLLQIIRERPALFAGLLRQLKSLPEHAVLRIVREIRDGEW